MKFSTKTTYGLRAMINLAKNSEKGSISLTSIAKDENISQRYLERLFANLKNAKLVKSSKGVSGGYVLSKKAESINALDIINALEGESSPFHCLDREGKVYCSSKCDCGVTSVLVKMQSAVNNALRDIKLSDLINRA